MKEPSLVHIEPLLRDTAVVGLVNGGLPVRAEEIILGVLLGPFGLVATIGVERGAPGELKLLIQRMYAECSVLASLRGPVLRIVMHESMRNKKSSIKDGETHG